VQGRAAGAQGEGAEAAPLSYLTGMLPSRGGVVSRAMRPCSSAYGGPSEPFCSGTRRGQRAGRRVRAGGLEVSGRRCEAAQAGGVQARRRQGTHRGQRFVPVEGAVVALACPGEGQDGLGRLRRQLRQQLDLHVSIRREQHHAGRGDCALAIAYERVAARIGDWPGRRNKRPERQQQKQGRAGATSRWLWSPFHGRIA